MAEVKAGPDTLYGKIGKRQRLEMLRIQMENERSSFMADWRDLGQYMLPRRPRFFSQDRDRGGRRNHHIIDSTATIAIRTMKSGMMGGITSPARPWVKLDTPDPELSEQEDVKEWLYKHTERLLAVMLKSNLYNTLPIIYGDMGCFATAAMLIEEDADEVFRTTALPVGSYCIAVDSKNRVNTFNRKFDMTVAQVIEKFGKKKHNGDTDWDNFNWENFSTIVKNAVEKNQWSQWITVVHFILPNSQYEPKALGPKGKKFASVYYELGTSKQEETMFDGDDTDTFLRESGYDLFPVLAPRWEVTGGDTYGTDSPGITCIGDVKSLQVMHKRKSQAIEKMVNPPLVGPASLRNTKTSLLPGDVTYEDARDGKLSLRPIHEVNFRIADLMQDIQDHQKRINTACFADLFLMMSMDDRNQPATATEINEKHEEKLLALGPVLEQLNQDLLNPLIDLIFHFMVKQGMIEPAPPSMHGMPLRVEYTSIMAQAQKLLGISATERFFQFVNTLAPSFPGVTDSINIDEAVADYGDKTSIAPKILRDPQQVAAIRQQRAQQQQQQNQAAMAAQQAQTAKHLAQAPTDGDNALTQLMQQGQAGNAVPQR